MKYPHHLLIMAMVAFLAGSCKKSTVAVSPLASLNITNVVVGGKAVKLNSNLVDSAAAYNFKAFGLNAGSTTSVYVYPTGDSTHPYFNNAMATSNGGVYSLFLAGNLATQVDTIFVRETIPVRTDSSCGVRFAHLSYNSSPIVVTLSTSTTVNEFALSYKEISSFKTYPALSTNGTYTMQVRDAGTNTILATYALTSPRFFYCTLIWKGMKGGTGTSVPGVLRVNNY